MRHSNAYAPKDAFDRNERRFQAVELSNPLNNASIDPDVPGISAGSNVFNSSGFQFMWGGELRTMQSVATGLNNKADGAADAAQAAMGRANQAYDAQAVKPTTAWVQARINNLQGQIDGAASAGAVAALASDLSALSSRVEDLVISIRSTRMKLNAAIEAMEVRPGYTRPTPIPYG